MGAHGGAVTPLCSLPPAALQGKLGGVGLGQGAELHAEGMPEDHLHCGARVCLCGCHLTPLLHFSVLAIAAGG